MKFKRILAAALSFVMTVSVASFTVSAKDAVLMNGQDTAAQYTFEGEFDYSEEKYVITMKYVGPKANMTALGFTYDKTVMSDAVVEYADIFESTETNFVNNADEAVYQDVLVPKASDSFGNDDKDPIEVATITFDMARENYADFNPAEDFAKLDLSDEIAGAYMNGEWLYIKYSEDYSLVPADRRYPVAYEILIDDKDIAITVDGADEEITTVLAPTSGTMLEGVTFTATTLEGETPADVTYYVDGEYVDILLPSDDGETYTIPGENVLGDITIHFAYGTPIEEVVITGIDSPKAQGTPDTTARTSGRDFTIEGVEWVSGDDVVVDGKFGFDTAYTVKVTVKAKEGYAFTSRATYTINGKTATFTRAGAGTGILYYTFESTEKELGKLSVSAGLVRASGNAAYENFGTITVKDAEGQTVATYTEGTDAGNKLENVFEIVAGEYTVEIAKNGYLTATLFATVEYKKTAKVSIDLIAGNIYAADGTDDDAINEEDFARLTKAFTAETDIEDADELAAYRKLVDINEDGIVTADDLMYIKANMSTDYGQ